MALRIRWDKYETSLLIDMFWKTEANPEQKEDMILNLSQALRKNAINKGYEIDYTFRNVTGIKMQLSSVEHAFFPERPGLKSNAGFDAMVKLYKENRNEFDAPRIPAVHCPFRELLLLEKLYVKGTTGHNRSQRRG